MRDSILVRVIALAVEELVWPFDNPRLLTNSRTLTLFAGIYIFACLCNVQHLITGISDNDRSLNVVLNMTTGISPINPFSFMFIVMGVAARSLIILNLLSVFYLVIVEALAQVAAKALVRDMKDKKQRSGGRFEKRDVDNLRVILEGGAWAQDQLFERTFGVNIVVYEIYAWLDARQVDEDMLKLCSESYPAE